MTPDRLVYRVKRRLLGQPLTTERVSEEKLSNRTALGVLASDCISSSAYGSEEMLRVLVPVVGAAAFTLVMPVTGALLLVDYVVTVAVQTSAGTNALISLAHLAGNGWTGLDHLQLPVSVGLVFLVAAVRALPGELPHADLTAPGDGWLYGASLFIVLRSFANGGSSLTGLEAISNGISAFREPQGRNARHTLIAMSCVLAVLVLGVSTLAHFTHAVPYTDGTPTVIAQEARLAFGDGTAGTAGLVFVQLATALVLYTGANTPFTGFPFLASFVAQDRFLPRLLTRRGHRLAFSNGIVTLSALSLALLLVTGASVDKLVALYAIGVYTAFTMAGAGLTAYHLRRREPLHRVKITVNALAAAVSAAVVLIFAATKFTEGAWLVVVVFPLGVWGLIRINRQRHHHPARRLLLRGSHRHRPHHRGGGGRKGPDGGACAVPRQRAERGRVTSCPTCSRPVRVIGVGALDAHRVLGAPGTGGFGTGRAHRTPGSGVCGTLPGGVRRPTGQGRLTGCPRRAAGTGSRRSRRSCRTPSSTCRTRPPSWRSRRRCTGSSGTTGRWSCRPRCPRR
ncbi:APC family permease [Streptomyces hyderabadensis]|uniref:APC family permease n=1 Tax=Streptomyces hyderabadensis TaxID=598549 RepID=UPI001CEFF750|nr:amino acid permease [Streptomyces hyderabadensis]